jgi:hypothetical protein
MVISRPRINQHLRRMLFCLGLACMTTLQAGEVSYQFQAGLDFSTLRYKEFDANGRLLDREDGPMPGLLIGAELLAPPYTLSLSTEGQYNSISYRGQTQIGVPLKTTTTETITRYSLKLMRNMSMDPHSLRLIAEVGERRWLRSIGKTATTNSLYEVYRWPYYLLGGAATLWHSEESSLDVQALAGKSFGSTLDARINGYDNTTLELKSGDTFLISLPFSYQPRFARRTLIIEPHAEYWLFEKSSTEGLSINGTPTGSLVHEPRNETLGYGINFSIRM